MGFLFNQDAPPQQLFTDIQNLNAFNDNQLQEFMDVIIAHLVLDPNAPSKLQEFADTHKVVVKALNTTLRGVLFFFATALKKNLAPDAVSSDVEGLGLSKEKASIVSDAWKAAFAGLSMEMMRKTLTVNKLLDMQWKFGVTAGSSEVDKAGQCFLQLKLVLDKGFGRTESVLMELSLPQFYLFLQEMEKLKIQLS